MNLFWRTSPTSPGQGVEGVEMVRPGVQHAVLEGDMHGGFHAGESLSLPYWLDRATLTLSLPPRDRERCLGLLFPLPTGERVGVRVEDSERRCTPHHSTHCRRGPSMSLGLPFGQKATRYFPIGLLDIAEIAAKPVLVQLLPVLVSQRRQLSGLISSARTICISSFS